MVRRGSKNNQKIYRPKQKTAPVSDDSEKKEEVKSEINENKVRASINSDVSERAEKILENKSSKESVVLEKQSDNVSVTSNVMERMESGNGTILEDELLRMTVNEPPIMINGVVHGIPQALADVSDESDESPRRSSFLSGRFDKENVLSVIPGFRGGFYGRRSRGRSSQTADFPRLSPNTPEHMRTVGLRSLEMGKRYQYQDDADKYYQIEIIGFSQHPGRYKGRCTRSNKLFLDLHPSQCLQAVEIKKDDSSQKFWTDLSWFVLDVVLTAGFLFCILWWDVEIFDGLNRLPYFRYYWHVLALACYLVIRSMWILFWPYHQKGVSSVPHFVSKKIKFEEQNKEVVLVGTCPMSPGSAADVKTVSDAIDPDAYLIEYDQKHIRYLRKKEEGPKPVTQELDLGDESDTVGSAVQAAWNHNLRNTQIDGALIFGFNTPEQRVIAAKGAAFNFDDGKMSLAEKILVLPLPEKKEEMYHVYRAQKRGAVAVFFLDTVSAFEKPSRVILTPGGLMRATKTCCSIKSTQLPSIPAYLLPEGSLNYNRTDAQLSFIVQSEQNINVPTIQKMWVRAFLIYGTGIGFIFKIVEALGVSSGKEFLVADDLSQERKRPLISIDMSVLNQLRSFLNALKPYPTNIWNYLRLWLSAVRIALSWIFTPMSHKIDVALNCVYGLARFKFRQWIAVILTVSLLFGVFFLIFILTGEFSRARYYFYNGVSENDHRGYFVVKTICAILVFWLIPATYHGFVVTRDEMMYRGIVTAIRARPQLKTFMVVTRANHSNGIMTRLHDFGI